MPIHEEDPDAARVEHAAAPLSITSHGESPLARVTLVADASLPKHLRANRAAARALNAQRAWTFAQDRLSDSVDVGRAWSPEEKLLHAIFGEKADSVAVDGLDEEGLPAVDAVIARGQQVLCDPRSRAKLHFIQAEQGAVRSVERVREGLPAGVAERVVVTVRCVDALQVGDTILCDDSPLGTVVDLVDDGADDPRIYGAVGAQREAMVCIGAPTALDRLEPTTDPSQPAIVGERVSTAAIAALIERGCLGVATDFASHHCDPSSHGLSVREALMQQGRVEHPFAATEPTATRAGSIAEASIFDLFDKRKAVARSTAALDRAKSYARALGATLDHDGVALTLSLAEDVTAGSEGEVQGDLGDPRLFGPRKDYECECGALRRMKHRGQRCETCGVAVESSRQRATLFAHIALREPVAHPVSGAMTDALSVLPPALRERRDPPLEAAYERALATRSASDARAVHALLVQRLCESIRWPETPVSAYAGGAAVVVDAALDPMHAVAPAAVLARLASPLLMFAAEQAGYASTVHFARSVVRDDPAARRVLLRWLCRSRPLLLAGAGAMLRAAWLADVSENPVFRVGVSLADALGVRTGDRLTAHLPVSDAAVRETIWLAESPPAAQLRPAPRADQSWVDALAFGPERERALRFASAAMEGARDVCASPNAAWLVGGYAIEDDAGLVDREPIPVRTDEARATDAAATTSALLERSIDELELSVRTMNALQGLGIATIRALVERSESELRETGALGPKSIKELKELLADMGLSLGMRG